MATRNYSRPTFDSVRAEQRQIDAEIVREFFSRVPEDTVLGMLAEELVESLLTGEAVREVEEQ